MITRAEELATEFLLPLWNEKSIEIIDEFDDAWQLAG